MIALSCNGNPGSASACMLDATDCDSLSSIIAGHDLVITLLPGDLDENVAYVCLDYNIPIVSTMDTLTAVDKVDQVAKLKHIPVCSEAGVAPGLDHIMSMYMIDHIHSHGGMVQRYTTLAGALPAPESAFNPLGYKVGWSVREAFWDLSEESETSIDGKVVYLPPREALKMVKPCCINPGMVFEVTPAALWKQPEYGMYDVCRSD